MILFFNVKITQFGIVQYHRHNWVHKDKRTDVFKYCIASYAPLKHLISKAIFYVELAPEFAHEKEELHNFILESFPDAIIYWHRNVYFSQWRETCEKDIFPLNDDVIWYCGNDDHIFIDYDAEVIADGIKLLENEQDQLAAIYYSHWPEQCRMSHHLGGELTESKNYLKYKWRTFDAIRAMKVGSFKHYWFDHNSDNVEAYRTDVLHQFKHIIPDGATVYAPTREIIRHYDGYSHLCQNVAHPDYLSNIIPPQIIPPGFFEKEMKVRIGFFDRKDGWTNLNPLAKYLYTADPYGVDYRWTEEDIPIFWKDRISELEINPDCDLQAMKFARDKSFLSFTKIPMTMYEVIFDHTYPLPPEYYYEKHLRYGKN